MIGFKADTTYFQININSLGAIVWVFLCAQY